MLHREMRGEKEKLAEVGAVLRKMGGAEHGVPPPAAGEPGMGNMERKDLLVLLAKSPQTLKAGSRGETRVAETDINPAARPFTDEIAWAFGVWHNVYVDRLIGLQSGLQVLRVEEMEALARTGVLRPLRYTSDPAIVAEMERSRKLSLGFPDVSGNCEPHFHGPEYYENGEGLAFFMRLDGSNYGATEADLPQYQACQVLYWECVREAYIEACTIGFRAGLLDESQLRRRIERAALKANAFFHADPVPRANGGIRHR